MWWQDVEKGFLVVEMRRWGGGVLVMGVRETVQREWVRHAATNPVTLNNAAEMGKEQSSSSLNGRPQLHGQEHHRV